MEHTARYCTGEIERNTTGTAGVLNQVLFVNEVPGSSDLEVSALVESLGIGTHSSLVERLFRPDEMPDGIRIRQGAVYYNAPPVQLCLYEARAYVPAEHLEHNCDTKRSTRGYMSFQWCGLTAHSYLNSFDIILITPRQGQKPVLDSSRIIHHVNSSHSIVEQHAVCHTHENIRVLLVDWQSSHADNSPF